MGDMKPYKCVNCGEPAAALFRNYGPSLLKLTKCEVCKEFVDKYIEYDPVIVMIDLVLMSREAQRHVIYNMEFKSYWKLLIILIMLETYGVWRSDSLFNIAINTVCGIQNNSTIDLKYLNIPFNLSMSETWGDDCLAWTQEEKGEDSDLFIWEKDFYIQFTSTFLGIVMFIFTVQSFMKFVKLFTFYNEISFIRLLKAFSLANVSILFTLPMLVWGNAETSPETRTLHYTLVFAYSFVMFANVFTVLYKCPVVVTAIVLLMSNLAKNVTSFHITPWMRRNLLYENKHDF